MGTVTTAGAGTTITFASPGVGVASIFLDPQSIYIPNHGLNLNDKVTYNTNTGTAISAWNGISTNTIGPAYEPLTDHNFFYIAPLTRDTIGLATNKVGLASTGGGYAGVGTDIGLLYFTALGTGSYHSLKTSLPSVISGEVSISTVTLGRDVLRL